MIAELSEFGSSVISQTEFECFGQNEQKYDDKKLKYQNITQVYKGTDEVN